MFARWSEAARRPDRWSMPTLETQAATGVTRAVWALSRRLEVLARWLEEHGGRWDKGMAQAAAELGWSQSTLSRAVSHAVRLRAIRRIPGRSVFGVGREPDTLVLACRWEEWVAGRWEQEWRRWCAETGRLSAEAKQRARAERDAAEEMADALLGDGPDDDPADDDPAGAADDLVGDLAGWVDEGLSLPDDDLAGWA